MSKFKTYTSDKNINLSVSKIFDKHDWAKTRKASNKYMFHKKNSFFFQYIFLNETSKLKIAAKLCEIYDFGSFETLLEIGGLPFVQSLVIKNYYPNLKFILTDFDESSINLHKGIEVFEKVDFNLETFDVKKDNLNIFSGKFDLLTMWGLDYALEDKELKRIFNFLKKERKNRDVRLILSSIRCDDIYLNLPFCEKLANKIIYKIRKFYKENKPILSAFIKNYKIRFHGYLRPPSSFYRLAKETKCECKLILQTNDYNIFEIM